MADALTATTQTQETVQAANDAARAYMAQSETAAPPAAAETPPPEPPAAPTAQPENDWIVKANYLEAERNLLAQRIAELTSTHQVYQQFEQDLQDNQELRDAVADFYKRKRGGTTPPPPAAPSAATESATAAAPPAPAVPAIDPRVAQALHAVGEIQNKVAEDFYKAELDRWVERLSRDPSFNKRQAALAARDYGIEIKDFDKAWEVAKDPFLGVVMRQYRIPVERWQDIKAVAAGIRNNQALAPAAVPAPPPIVQAAPAVRLPPPSGPISTAPAPFAPRPNMSGAAVTSAALDAWAQGRLHN